MIVALTSLRTKNNAIEEYGWQEGIFINLLIQRHV